MDVGSQGIEEYFALYELLVFTIYCVVPEDQKI